MNSVRIVGGEFRRRVLRFPDSEGLRPTPDRVRETLFNWLGHDLTGLSALDLFAGSGVLGLEAASRGAAPVRFVERDRRIHATLSRNLARFGGADAGLHAWRGDALEFAAFAVGETFDLVFVDPPYRQGWLARLWPALVALTRSGSRIYVEAEAPVTAPDPWQICRLGHAGQVHFHLLSRT